MRSNPRISVFLAAISVCLLLAFYSSVRSEEAEKAKPSVKELQQKRLAILEQMQAIAGNLFQNARIDYPEVLAAQRELLKARLEYAETREERIKACDEVIKNALATQEIAESRKAAARGSQLAVFSAQAFVLEAQIAREKIEASK